MDQLTETFEANGTTWKTDRETLDLLREYRECDNDYMLGLVFTVGQDFGRIAPVEPETEEEPDDTDWQDFLSYHSGIKL